MDSKSGTSAHRYHFKITADQRVYTDWRKNGGGTVKFKYADNCKKCKHHRKNEKRRFVY